MLRDGLEQGQGLIGFAVLKQRQGRVIHAVPLGFLGQGQVGRPVKERGGPFVIPLLHQRQTLKIVALHQQRPGVLIAGDFLQHPGGPFVFPGVHGGHGGGIQAGGGPAVSVGIVPRQEEVFGGGVIILSAEVLVAHQVIGPLQFHGRIPVVAQLPVVFDGRLGIVPVHGGGGGLVQALLGVGFRVLIIAQLQEFFPGGGVFLPVHQGHGPVVHRLGALLLRVAVVKHQIVEGDGVLIFSGGLQLFRVHIPGFLGALGAVLVIAQGVEARLGGPERGIGAAVQGGQSGLIITFLGLFAAVLIILQGQELLLGRVILAVLQGQTGPVVFIIGNPMEIDAVSQPGDHRQRNQGGEQNPAAAAALPDPGLLFRRDAAGFLPGPALLLLQGALPLEKDGFNGGFVQLGKDFMLVPVAAAADVLPCGVGPPADAHPHAALVAGIAGGVPAGQFLHHLQLGALEQRRGRVHRSVGHAPPPDGAIVVPDLFDQDFQIHGLHRFFHDQPRFKGVMGRPVQALDALHVAGIALPGVVVTEHAHLNALHVPVRQVVYLHGQHRIVLGGHPAMP